MCENCSIDEVLLGELMAEEATEEKTSAQPGDFDDAKMPIFELAEIAPHIKRQRPVWVSAGTTRAGASKDHDAPSRPASDLLLRDALGQLARVFFERDLPLPIVVGWDSTITPLLLDVASRFGGGQGPLVSVFVTDSDLKVLFHPMSAADWRRGELVRVPGFQPRIDARQAMVGCDIRAAIFLGGGKSDVLDDAQVPLGKQTFRFAVGSTGGAAHMLLASHGSDYAGGNRHLAAELKQAGSYLLLFRDIAKALP